MTAEVATMAAEAPATLPNGSVDNGAAKKSKESERRRRRRKQKKAAKLSSAAAAAAASDAGSDADDDKQDADPPQVSPSLLLPTFLSLRILGFLSSPPPY